MEDEAGLDEKVLAVPMGDPYSDGLNDLGEVQWQAPLAEPPVGTPATSIPSGPKFTATIRVGDNKAGGHWEYMLNTSLGHCGWGGSCVFADPETGVSAAYVMTRQSPHLIGDPRALRLIEALYAAL